MALKLRSCWVLQICKLNSLRFLTSRAYVPNHKYSSESSQARDEGSSFVKVSRGLDLEESAGFHLLDGDQTCESPSSCAKNLLNFAG
jgi:hypothetical protein